MQQLHMSPPVHSSLCCKHGGHTESISKALTLSLGKVHFSKHYSLLN